MPRPPATRSTFQLRYAQLEELVAHLLDAHPDRKSPLSARFRLFRQRGFPPNVTTLAKTRFAYDLDSVLRVALAFWMMKAFIPQETIPIVLEKRWDDLRRAFEHAFRLVGTKGVAASCVDDERRVLLMQPKNLHAFTLAKDVVGEVADTVGLEVVSARTARERLLGDPGEDGGFEPVTLIDLHRLASWARDYIIGSGWSGPEPFASYPSS